MSYQNSYPSAPDYVIGADIAESPQKPLGTRLKTWLFSPRSGPAIDRTMQQLEADRCHAFLTASALRHTVGLSAMEQRAIDFAPQGAHRYADLVDGYAEAAARMVRGWR